MVLFLKSLFSSRRGQGALLTSMMLAAIGLVVVGGLTKMVLHRGQLASKKLKKVRSEQVAKNVWGLVGSYKAWNATLAKAHVLQANCYPGAEDPSASGSPCFMNYWFDPLNSSPQATYETNAKKWAVTWNNAGEEVGYGFMKLSGEPIFPEILAGSCHTAGGDPEACLIANNADFEGTYLKVEIRRPVSGWATDNNDIPDLQISVNDVSGTQATYYFKHIKELGSRPKAPGGILPSGTCAIETFDADGDGHGDGIFHGSCPYTGTADVISISCDGRTCVCRYACDSNGNATVQADIVGGPYTATTCPGTAVNSNSSTPSSCGKKNPSTPPYEKWGVACKVGFSKILMDYCHVYDSQPTYCTLPGTFIHSKEDL